VQRRNFFECQCRSVIRSARCYAGGDGAARRPYHRAKHMRCDNPAAFSGGTARTDGSVCGEVLAPLDAALLVAARRVLPR